MDVYKIGVSIALANGVSAVLAVIQKDVMGLHKAVNMTNAGFNRMKLAVGGLAAVGLGGLMLKGLYDLHKAGDKYIAQLEQMKLAGFDAMETQQAIRAADRVSSNVMTTTPAENLQAIRDLRGALNSAGASNQAATREAIEYLEVVQKAQAVMNSTVGGRAAGANGGVYDMVKGLEEIGATLDPHRFEKLIGGMVQAAEAFGGKITGRDWFQTLKYTRTAGRFYDDDFIMHYLPTLMQEMKVGSGSGQGGGPGNPLASLFQATVANVFSRNTRDLGIKLGLIDPNLSTVDKHGRIHNQPGAWFGADLAASNPALWAQKFLIPHLSSQMGGHMMDVTASGQFVHVKEMAGTIATLFGNRTAAQMINLLMQVKKMEGDKRLLETAMSLGKAFSEVSKADPATVRKEFTEQLERVQADLGKNISPMVTEALYYMAMGLSKLAEVIEQHPVATKVLLAIVAGLGGLLVVLGTLAIGMAALSAIGGIAIAGTIAGILALGGAIAWLAIGDHWSQAKVAVLRWARVFGETLSHGLAVVEEALPRGMKRVAYVLARGMDVIVEAFPRGLKMLTDAIKGWIDTIPALAGQVSAALAQVGSAILNWAKGLIGLSAVQTPSASSADRPHSGVGPIFGPQSLGDPSQAPGLLGRRSSYVPAPANSNHVTLINYTVVDGQTVAKSVSRHIVNSGSGPSSGMTGFDPRGGFQGNMQAIGV